MSCIHREIALSVTELNRLCAAGADRRAIEVAETRVNRAVAVESSGMLWRTLSSPYGRAVAGVTQVIYLPCSTNAQRDSSCCNLLEFALVDLESTRCAAVTTSLDVGIAISLAGEASVNSHYGPFASAI